MVEADRWVAWMTSGCNARTLCGKKNNMSVNGRDASQDIWQNNWEAIVATTRKWEMTNAVWPRAWTLPWERFHLPPDWSYSLHSWYPHVQPYCNECLIFRHYSGFVRRVSHFGVPERTLHFPVLGWRKRFIIMLHRERRWSSWAWWLGVSTGWRRPVLFLLIKFIFYQK